MKLGLIEGKGESRRARFEKKKLSTLRGTLNKANVREIKKSQGVQHQEGHNQETDLDSSGCKGKRFISKTPCRRAGEGNTSIR